MIDAIYLTNDIDNKKRAWKLLKNHIEFMQKMY